MSYSRSLHNRIDADLVAQIESHGRVKKRNKSLVRGLDGSKRPKPRVIDGHYRGPIRKNQKRDAYF